MPSRTFTTIENCKYPSLVEYLVAWGRLPNELLLRLPQLKAIFSLGAGVDKLIAAGVSPHASIYRLLDAGMSHQMAEYVRWGVLTYQRNIDIYRAKQLDSAWTPLIYKSAVEVSVGVLGLGDMGLAVGLALHASGYRVYGWSRSPRSLPGIVCFHGDSSFNEILGVSDVIACLVPLTPETRGLLGAEEFRRLRSGSMLINASRGAVVDEDALLDALDTHHLRGAPLDVFQEEPLPRDHRLWRHLGFLQRHMSRRSHYGSRRWTKWWTICSG